MSFEVSNNLQSAFASGNYGLQKASEEITEASSNIARQNIRESVEAEGNAARQTNPADAGNSTPQANTGSNLTNDLISLKENSIYAQASAKVISVADRTIGRLIDEIA
ncbi:hypothetical protein OE749_14105 [Aestuariibacter sp. AA17]|uniref:Flagellar basal-body/hook protein C-terminal domain-containing protein n=1 Tax=Fluctibacter corallii TaxID=2984329 RepID=A0ABT3AB55_9ALTE|nr:hypothetical protein [Aestuariibacter sp. AA17]MCV2885827.1 hypothetical protein [Aestuariibacter sp. AA17]